MTAVQREYPTQFPAKIIHSLNMLYNVLHNCVLYEYFAVFSEYPKRFPANTVHSLPLLPDGICKAFITGMIHLLTVQYSRYAVRCSVTRYIPCKYDSVTDDALLLLCNQVQYKQQLLSRQNDQHSSLQL
jgi:hypothetical protein